MLAREIYILKKLSQMENNGYTVRLRDAFVNDAAKVHSELLEEIYLVFDR